MAAKKVTIMVGFVPIRTRMEVAVDSETSNTHAVCTGTEDNPHEPARVKMSVGCSHEGCDIVHSSTFGFRQRGVERGDKLVVLSTEEIAEAKGEPITGRDGKQPVQLGFHPREKVYGSTVASDSVQNVYPDKGGEKAYALLRDALVANPDVAAVMIWAPTTSNALWVLDVVDQRIVASKRCWPENMRPAMGVPEVEVLDAEAEMFNQLVQASVQDFDLLAYADQSKRSLEDLIAARAEGALPIPTDSPTVAPDSVNMLAALAKSLEATQPTAKPKKATAKKKAA